MKVTLEPEIAEMLGAKAEVLGTTVDNLVNIIVATSVNVAFSLGKIEFLLESVLMEKMMSLQANLYATRHQIMNFHADASHTSDRALAISNEGTQLGFDAIFGAEEEEDESEK